MKPKQVNWWMVVAMLAIAAFASYISVDTFKIANGQFHRDATHTYSDRICTGSKGSGSKVCTNYYFTEKQYQLNGIIDKAYIVLIVLTLLVSFIVKTLVPTREDKKELAFRKDPISSINNGWNELMVENEKQKKDPSHGWTSSGIRTFFGITLLGIFLTALFNYFNNSDWFENILKIN